MILFQRCLRLFAVCAAWALGAGCAMAGPARSYRMGFSFTHPPRQNPEDMVQRFALWAQRADGAIIEAAVPWEMLLAGNPPQAVVQAQLSDQVRLLRSRGFMIVITLDPLNGLDRSRESPALAQASRSVAEPDIQQLYRAYALAVAQVARPDYLGLAAEVNSVMRQAPPAAAEALQRMVNAAADDIRSSGIAMRLYVSVQVEEAWGAWGRWDEDKTYAGLGDFYEAYPFLDALGLSTYSYAGWRTPEALPDDYFHKLLQGRALPVLITESGWPSKFAAIGSTEELQARWIGVLGNLAQRAGAVFVGQLLFSDIEPALMSAGGLEQFATQGLVDYRLQPKPALAAWDRLFKQPCAATP